MKKSRLLLFLSLILLTSFTAFAQNRKVTGVLTDTTNLALSDILVLLIIKQDTLKTLTDDYGYFSFDKIKSDSVKISISALGFKTYQTEINFIQKKKVNLGDIKLETLGNTLKEVVIRAKPIAVKYMQDTIEFNAAAYNVQDGDNIADLLKQFNGVEVDENYNVKTNDENVVKLRVNGEDFFTGNVNEFIKTLPAGIVSKIQLIDDYGDQANFKGLKIDQPKKMINIVTKPDMNKGRFGNGKLNAGSNKQLVGQLNLNLWNGTKQSNLGLTAGTNYNGAGNNTNRSFNVSHADKLNEKWRYSLNLGSRNNVNATKNENFSETNNSFGTYYNETINTSNNTSNNQNFNSTINYKSKKTFLNVGLSGSYQKSLSNSFNSNYQKGIIKQDFLNETRRENKAPQLSTNINYTRKLNDKGSSISTNFTYSYGTNESLQNINTNTLYYQQTNFDLLKDSLLIRKINTESQSHKASFNTGYALALNKVKDSLTGKKTLSLAYRLNFSKGLQSNNTAALNNITQIYYFVDSLSNEISSSQFNQTINLTYNYNHKKRRLNIGLGVFPQLIKNEIFNTNQSFNKLLINYAPTISYNRVYSNNKNLRIAYNGNTNNPQINQLQPVRNIQNLQNVIIGNPSLNPSFNHQVNGSYQYNNRKTNFNSTISANFSYTQNAILKNTKILEDTLNTFKQETSYINANGGYKAGTNYSISWPLVDKKIRMGYNGSINHQKTPTYLNSTRYNGQSLSNSHRLTTAFNFNKTLNMDFNLNYTFRKSKNVVGINNFEDFADNGNPSYQGTILQTSTPLLSSTLLSMQNTVITNNLQTSINSRLKLKTFNLNGVFSYGYSETTNSDAANSDRKLHHFTFSVNGDKTIKKTYRASLSLNKNFNTGYALNNQNPLLINCSINKTFMKNRALSFFLSATDLLNQGAMLRRQINGNAVIDTKPTIITQIFSLGLNYSLSKFGGNSRSFRVDED